MRLSRPSIHSFSVLPPSPSRLPYLYPRTPPSLQLLGLSMAGDIAGVTTSRGALCLPCEDVFFFLLRSRVGRSIRALAEYIVCVIRGLLPFLPDVSRAWLTLTQGLRNDLPGAM